MKTYFAAIDSGNLTGAVYGVGRTEDEALADAREYDADTEGCAVVRCTAAAYEHVREHGGAPSKLITVSRDGVMLRSEEE